MARLLVFVISFTVRVLKAVIRSSDDLVIENAALRRQVATLIKHRRRPTLDNAGRAFWVALRAAWPWWTNTLVIVKTDTVAKWRRDRFCRHCQNVWQIPVVTTGAKYTERFYFGPSSENQIHH